MTGSVVTKSTFLRALMKILNFTILDPIQRADKWVSRSVKEPRRGESGWYVHTGEGRAIAAGAEATEGVDTTTSLGNPNIELAIDAVRQAKVPEGSDFDQALEATFEKYRQLRSASENQTTQTKGT
jgi:hypothetical protein